MRRILIKFFHLLKGYFYYLYTFLKRKYYPHLILVLYGIPIFFILSVVVFIEHLGYAFLLLFYSLLLALFFSNLMLLFDYDNVKCPKCKFRRVNHPILGQENLGIANLHKGRYPRYYMKTTYKCCNCNNVFKIECVRELDMKVY